MQKPETGKSVVSYKDIFDGAELAAGFTGRSEGRFDSS